uniref:Fibronectin type-II domain-containing protein n=1 Tax=Alexandrium monilatum TaxID=311494 RepID=A0A7S4QWT8_9DINO
MAPAPPMAPSILRTFVIALCLWPCALARENGPDAGQCGGEVPSTWSQRIKSQSLMQVRVRTAAGIGQSVGSVASRRPQEGLGEEDEDYVTDQDNSLEEYSEAGEAGADEGSHHARMRRASQAEARTVTSDFMPLRTPQGNDTSRTCVTRMDSRASHWAYTTSPPGTPCFFGVDVRDEGSHCIMEDGEYGSYGWCWTATDRSSFGSCSEDCPLPGPDGVLDKKLDRIQKELDMTREAVANLAGMLSRALVRRRGWGRRQAAANTSKAATNTSKAPQPAKKAATNTSKAPQPAEKAATNTSKAPQPAKKVATNTSKAPRPAKKEPARKKPTTTTTAATSATASAPKGRRHSNTSTSERHQPSKEPSHKKSTTATSPTTSVPKHRRNSHPSTPKPDGPDEEPARNTSEATTSTTTESAGNSSQTTTSTTTEARMPTTTRSHRHKSKGRRDSTPSTPEPARNSPQTTTNTTTRMPTTTRSHHHKSKGRPDSTPGTSEPAHNSSQTTTNMTARMPTTTRSHDHKPKGWPDSTPGTSEPADSSTWTTASTSTSMPNIAGSQDHAPSDPWNPTSNIAEALYPTEEPADKSWAPPAATAGAWWDTTGAWN